MREEKTKTKKERLVSYGGGTLSEFPPGPLSCTPKPPTARSLLLSKWAPAPPTTVPVFTAEPPEVDCSEVVTSIVVCKPWPPGIPRLALRLEPPLHVVLVGVSVQFNFAKAGVAALILTVVTAAIIADFKIIFSRFEKGLQSR
jgi:hypothetical protein